MSFQRIVELARQRGLPIIVTDIGARAPMVVLPLEEYERLADGAMSGRKIPISLGKSDAPTVSYTNVQEAQESTPQKKEVMGEKSQTESEPLASDLGGSVDVEEFLKAGSLADDGLLLEERFYLEPLDETLD